MPDSDSTEVFRQLVSIRRELRFARVLLLFVSTALAIILFAPSWAARLAECAPVVVKYCSPIFGFVVLVVIAAAIVSRYAPARASTPTVPTKDPAA